MFGPLRSDRLKVLTSKIVRDGTFCGARLPRSPLQVGGFICVYMRDQWCLTGGWVEIRNPKSKIRNRLWRGGYNSAMDETPIIDEPEAEGPQAPAKAGEAPQSKAPAPTEVVFEGLAAGKEPWRGGGGCSSRLPLYGCLFGLVLLIGTLIAGTSMMRRTVWVNLERARRAVAQSLPRDLPAAEVQRTIKNLEQFRAVLEASKDPYPEMGEFVNRVRAVLQDGRLTVDEVGGLNVYIERVIEESGIPPFQLGFRISDFGFRICSRAFGAPGGRSGNPKFEIRNSKLSPA